MTMSTDKRRSLNEGCLQATAAPPPENAMTFDVEEWFQAHNLEIPRQGWDNYPSRLDRPIDEILSLLDHYDTRSTFFVLGWVASRNPSIVRRIHRAGHEIADHGFWHRRVSNQPFVEFQEDVRRSKAVLEDLIGQPVNGYRAPSYSLGSNTEWAFDVLEGSGFTYDSSIYPTRAPHGRYGWSGSPLTPYRLRPGLWEFPLPTLGLLGFRIPAGTGAYLRLLPLSVTLRALRQNLLRSVPVVVNVHPWELDPGQPRVRASRWNRMLHYTNLSTTRRKLAGLLESFRFAPLCDLRDRAERRDLSAVRQVDQKTKPVREVLVRSTSRPDRVESSVP